MSPQHMYVVGLTGGIGSGKSAAGNCFRQLSIEVVDADIAARAAVEPGTEALKKISNHFGSDIIKSDGSLDRRKLRTLIFDDAKQRQWLEALLHPLIRQWIIDAIQSATSPYVILESPLLFETNQHQMVSKSIVVDVSEELQVQRYVKRDGGTSEQAKAVIASQIDRQQRLSKADYIVDNTGSLKALEQTVKKLHTELLKQSKTKHHE